MKKILLILIPVLFTSCATKNTIHSSIKHENIKIGKPYKVANKWYHPKQDGNYNKVGIASWYGPNFHGKLTANGEIFNQEALTAAHKTLPLPSIVKVTNLSNKRSILVRINDRGPFVDDRIIDLSSKVATVLGFKNKGIEKVRVQYMAKETDKFIADLKNNNLHNNEIWLAENSHNVKTIEENIQIAENELDIAEDNIDSNHILDEIRDSEITKVSNQSKERLVFVQAGTFNVKDNAHKLVQKLAHIGSTVIVPTNINNNILYKVRFGPFMNNHEAEHIYNQLVALGNHDAMIVNDHIEFIN